jgi:hypothetical protein
MSAIRICRRWLDFKTEKPGLDGTQLVYVGFLQRLQGGHRDSKDNIAHPQKWLGRISRRRSRVSFSGSLDESHALTRCHRPSLRIRLLSVASDLAIIRTHRSSL